MTIVRAPFAYASDSVSDETGLECLDDSLTVQSDLEDTDINVLVKRFGVTGEMPVLSRLPLDGDFHGLLTYQQAQNALIEAQASFMELPAEVRKRFDHDPARFVSFCSDSKNLPELRELGLAPAAPDVVPPVVVPPVPPVAA